MDDIIQTLDELVRASREYRDIMNDIESFNPVLEQTSFIKYLRRQIEWVKEFVIDKKEDILYFYKISKNDIKIKQQKVQMVDGNLIMHSYKDYHDGILSYIKEINKSINDSNGIDNEEKIKIIKKLDAIITKDESFIDDLCEIYECGIDELILNIETTVDLIPFYKECISNIDSLFSMKNSEPDISVMLIKLYTQSVDNFIRSISHIITESYNKIKLMINGETNKIRPNVEISAYDDSQSFKIW